MLQPVKKQERRPRGNAEVFPTTQENRDPDRASDGSKVPAGEEAKQPLLPDSALDAQKQAPLTEAQQEDNAVNEQ